MTTSTPIQRRLKQVPVDVWSTKEKLCLASFVLKSGDQNWSSVSRPLKAFGEPNRPADWFSQKNCALQYNDLLDRIETPKRKRNERGEETAENLIVKKLKAERIEELLKLVKEGKERCQLIKQELDLVKSGKADEAKLNQVWNRKLAQEKAKKQEEIDYKKWLEERQTKIAAMKRGIFQGLASPQKPQTSDTPTTSLKLKTDLSVGSPLSIDIDIDSNLNNSQIGLENKLNLPHTGTSTSPLLTSLLQSPTPSTPTILPTVNPFQTNAIKSHGTTTTTPSPTSQTSQPFFPPTISTAASPSRQIIISTTQTSTGVNLVVSGGGDVIAKNSSSTTVTPSSSPTLSKLLEMPPSVPGKLPPLPIIEAQASAPQVESQIRTRSSPTKLNILSGFKNDELKEGGDGKKIEKQESVKDDKTSRSEKVSASRADNKIDNDKQEAMEEDVFTENENEQNKRENVTETDSNKEMMNIQIKKELLDIDSTPSTPGNNSSLTTPSSAKAKRKRNLNVTPVTVIPTRRSGRVKARDLKESVQEENTESNEAQTPSSQSAKKRASVDETTETSMSEESVDVTKSTLLQTSESIPNSPASSTMHSEDADNNKEYKVWKKSIMLAYKTAATHKFASLFFQPVTDEEAEGYSDVVYKPMDLQTIKRKIENGTIRSTVEFQRDIMLMFQNAIMYNSADHDVHQMAVEMQKEIIESIEDFIESQKQTNQSSESSAKLRSRERRSTAVQGTPSLSSQSPSISTSEESGRRKSRGASTDTDTSFQSKVPKKKTSTSSKN